MRSGVSDPQKMLLHDYLAEVREAVLWKAEGLSEYDVRRPLTRTGTNLDLDAPGHVPWWSRPDVTLHGILVHVLAETARYAGHADIVREQIDARSGMRADNVNVEPHDAQWWAEYRSQIEAHADAAGFH